MKKRKGGRPGKNERVFDSSDYNNTDVVESYYSNSKSLHTLVNSKDEDEVSSIPKYPSFNEETDMSNSVPQIGLEFEGPPEFRDFIRQYKCMRGMTLSSQRTTVIKSFVHARLKVAHLELMHYFLKTRPSILCTFKI